MNQNESTDDPSRGKEGISSDFEENPSDSTRCISDKAPNDMMKRAAAKSLIERYFYQLVDGCGNPNCSNHNCASSGEVRNLTPNEAAAEAIKLFQTDAKLCDVQPTKVARTDVNIPTSSESTLSSPPKPRVSIAKAPCDSPAVVQRVIDNQSVQSDASQGSSKEGSFKTNKVNESKNEMLPVQTQSEKEEAPLSSNGVPLTEERVGELCRECLETNQYSTIVSELMEAFSEPTILARCFASKTISSTSNSIENEESFAKEVAGISSGDPDKDIDSVSVPELDVEACRRALQHLSMVPEEFYSSSLVLALLSLAENLENDLKNIHQLSNEDVVNCIVIVFEMPDLCFSDYLDLVVPALCQAASYMSMKGQAHLAKIWATKCRDSLRHILETLQQLITIRVISRNYTRFYAVQDDKHVTMATKLMKIVYYANMIAGSVESQTLREEPVIVPSQLDPLGDSLDHMFPRLSSKESKEAVPEDPLGNELNVNILDVRRPFLPFEEFYNEPLSDIIEMDKDLTYFKADPTQLHSRSTREMFAFLRFPFILTPTTKSLGLYYDNRIRMYAERRVSFVHAFVGVAPPQPYLRLKVRRNHIIDDALVELEMIAMERALDLKKQLVVEFVGEQGVDEGGVSKEFFQLVVDEIFNPDYGMFTTQTDARNVWFNPTSFETEAQFTLIGIVLGLAIYNNIILAVSFPMVVYRKLMGKKGSFEDLADWNPQLYNGLRSMLDYEGDDMEEVFVQTFRICHRDVFGNHLMHDLKENGDDIFVNQNNKWEFVESYADYLLNKSVETQFKAFRRGFIMVTNESPLSLLFRPEEVELLVCGSQNFDFIELEKSTEYDGGYTADTSIIKHFWSIAHSLNIDDQRKLLQFTTGSDRVPVGGLSHLKLVIARNGPDSDRLPTAHTCFNVLLLPEYESKEKLEDRLLKAISYSKGFGML